VSDKVGTGKNSANKNGTVNTVWVITAWMEN